MSIVISPANNPVTNTLYFQKSVEPQPFVPPVETFYILAENGDYITDESGNRLIQEIAP